MWSRRLAECQRWKRARHSRGHLQEAIRQAGGLARSVAGDALCHGWVDSLGTRIDEERYAIRFTPRRPGSKWSAKNREIARRLLEEGRMTAAGIAALPDEL